MPLEKRNLRDPIRFFQYLFSNQHIHYELVREEKKGFFVVSSAFQHTNQFNPKKSFKFIEFAIISNNSGKINFKEYSLERFRERLYNSSSQEDFLYMLEYRGRLFRFKRFLDMSEFFQLFDQRKTIYLRSFVNRSRLFLEFEINDRYSLVISEFSEEFYQTIIKDPKYENMFLEMRKERLEDYIDLKIQFRDIISDDIAVKVNKEIIEKLKVQKSKTQTNDSAIRDHLELQVQPKNGVLKQDMDMTNHIPKEDDIDIKEGSDTIGLPDVKIKTRDRTKDNIALLQRKATIYIKEKGFQIGKELTQQSRWKDSQISKQFIKNRFFIPKLVSMGLLSKLTDTDEYGFTAEEKNILITHFHKKKIIDWSIKYYEEKLNSLDGYRDFINLTYEDDYAFQGRFFQPFIKYSEQFVKRIQYWEDIESRKGILHFYLKGRKYFEIYNYEQRRKYLEKYFDDYDLNSFDKQISEIKSTVEKYEYLALDEEYDRLGRHFSICVNHKCEECGGNIINTMMLKIEPIRKKIIDELIFRNELENLKMLPYNMDLQAVSNLAEQFKEFSKLETKFEEYCKAKNLDWSKRSQKNQRNDFIPAIIEHSLRALIYHNINRLYRMKLMTLDPQKKKSENISMFEYVLKTYRNSVEILNTLVKPLTFLSSLERKLNEQFIYNEKIFHEYDTEIKKIGREGEKIMFEGLKEEYRDNQNIEIIWANENIKGTGTKQPYDILIRHPNGEQDYIEVKTSHSSEKAFTMSQNEIDFAEKKKENYSIYLITNLGKGFDTELEIIKDIYEKIDKNKIQSVSRRFKL